MADGISLSVVARAFEGREEGKRVFLHYQTGEIQSITEEGIALAESPDPPELAQEQQQTLRQIREVIGSPDWLEIPPRSRSREYHWMERFCVEMCDEDVQSEILELLHGKGAFGRFRAEIEHRGLQTVWQQFRRVLILEEAEGWLQDQAIDYIK